MMTNEIKPWWDLNDPEHPSKRNRKNPPVADQRTDVLRCGILGGAMALYWYYIGCPGMMSKRPLTPAFYN